MDGKTVARYLDLMVDLLLVRRLAPWYSNVGKRLVKSPKVYVRDSGILHALLGLKNKEAVMGHPVVGSSWEGFVIESLLSVVRDGTKAGFYRSSGGAEIDLVLSFPGNHLWAIDVKRSLTPKPERGFHSACAELKPAAQYLVYPGSERFLVTSGVVAIGPYDLAQEINQEGYAS